VQKIEKVDIVLGNFTLGLYVVDDSFFGCVTTGRVGNDHLSFEVIQVFVGHFNGSIDLPSISDDRVEVLLEILHAHLDFEIPFTIKLSSLDEAFTMFLNSVEKQAVSWDNFIIIKLQDVSHSDLVTSHFMETIDKVFF
jgi:hypothetical protein